MGAASCRSSKSNEQNQGNDDRKQITIGVFGIDNAGKTSTVKAIEGSPTKNVMPTPSTNTSTVPYPSLTKRDDKPHEPIQIIDVSGTRRFREQSWVNYYDQIHGLIFVMDASDKKRMKENKQTLDDLLDNDKLRDKPILILANKQDRKDAIDDEDEIKDQLDIEQLKVKYKIEFCTAIPSSHKDDSIRKGFSWLIRTIEENYTDLNARVNKAKTSNRPKPNERKNDKKNQESNSDDDVSYSKTTPVVPKFSKTNNSYHSTIDSHKLPSLNLSKSKALPSGRETHDVDDDDDIVDSNRVRSRPVISPTDNGDDYYRKRSPNEFSGPTTNATNKKKKLIGVSKNANKDTSLNKKVNDNEPKSYRSSYEPYPDEEPWSVSSRKTAKSDDIMPKPFSKSSLTNDTTKKYTSPLVYDTKPYGSSPKSKGANYSDNDDDDSSTRDRNKSLFPPQSRFNNKDDDFKKSTSPYSTSKSPVTMKKIAAGLYVAGDDDDDKFNNKIGRRPFGATPAIKKLSKFDEEDEDDNDSFKKPTPRTTKGFDSDEDDKKKNTKSYLSSSNHLNFDSDSRRLTSKPPPSSPSTTIKRPKDDDDDEDSIMPKPLNRARFGNDNYTSTSSKLPNRLTTDDGIDRLLATSKSNPNSKFSTDDDDLYKKSTSPYSTSKSSVTPKKVAAGLYGAGDDDDDKFNNKSGRRPFGATPAIKKLSKFDEEDEDDNDSFKKPTAKTTKSFDSDEDDKKKNTKSYLSSSNQLNFDSDSRRLTSKPPPSSPSTTIKRPKDDDDDEDSTMPKPLNRSRFNNDTTKPLSSYKPSTNSKKDDDDDDDDDDGYKSKSKSKVPSKFEDDDDLPSSSSKYGNRSKYDDDYSKSSTSKPTVRSKYDDDDDIPSSFGKSTTQTRFGKNERSLSPPRSTSISRKVDDKTSSTASKINSRSKYEDDDDDLPPVSSKPSFRSKYDDDKSSSPINLKSQSKFQDDDYPSSSSKVGARSKFDDDDRPTTSPRLSSRPKYTDDDYMGRGSSRSRVVNEDFDSSKGGFSSARVKSAAADRFRTNTNDDD